MQPIAALATGWTTTALGAPLALAINAAMLIAGATALLATGSDLRRWRPIGGHSLATGPADPTLPTSIPTHMSTTNPITTGDSR